MRKLRIASRKSDLARVQAIAVGAALAEQWPDLTFDFQFSESLGDKNLTDPLWKIPDKGVFTSDLTRSLAEGACDLVVHSWKDLPIEADSISGPTMILGAPPRSDARDVILFSRNAIQEWSQGGTLKVLSSSPRREAHLPRFLKTYLPSPPAQVEFHSVRGNIPTRIQKLLDRESGAHALVVAQAALLRLLNPPCFKPWSDFEGVAERLRKQLDQCRWIVCPISINPPAPGQGALALEIRRDDSWVRQIVETIVDPESTENARDERKVLAQYGGGCHQAIGISYARCSAGRIRSVRGLGTNERLLLLTRARAAHPSALWSSRLAEVRLFERVPIPESVNLLLKKRGSRDIYWRVSHPDALPQALRPEDFPAGHPSIWCAGQMTWRELADRGWWVEGSDDSLGETSSPLASWRGSRSWVIKLEHEDSPSDAGANDERVSTYRLRPIEFKNPREDLRIRGKTHFFWRSYTQFQRVTALCPEVREAHHACGPGHTAKLLSHDLGEPTRLEIFLDEEDWRKTHGLEN